MTESLREALERVGNVLVTHGVEVPTDHLERIRASILPHELSALAPEHPIPLVEAHFKFMDARLDDVTTIVFYQAMSDLFAANFHALKPAFAQVKMSAFKSRIVLSQKLASRYFHEGRRRVSAPATAASGTWLLRRCVDLSTDVVGRDDRASAQSLRIMHSQIATSSALVARAMARPEPNTTPDADLVAGQVADRIALLRSGLHHSLAAEANGDASEDHDGYQLELALRLHEATTTGSRARPAGETNSSVQAPSGSSLGSPLDQVDEAVARARKSKSPILQAAVGDVDFARASLELQAGNPGRAVPHLMRASGRYDKAIAAHPQKNLPHAYVEPEAASPRGARTDIGYLFAKRGRCSMLLYWFATDAFGRRDTVQLDRALADWSQPSSAGHRRDHEVARLQLARARMLSARGATQDARDALDEAAKLFTSNSGADPTAVALAGIDGQTAGLDIEAALDSADVRRVVEALQSAAALPPLVPAPSGSMSKAVIWLKSRMAEQWGSLAELVLDRIEVDSAHAALNEAARGHLAGHAATVARAIFLQGDAGEQDLIRAVELSRAHVENASTSSSAALDGASRAAFALASGRVSRSDSLSEDELGIWRDALTWALSALQAEQDVPTPTDSRIDAADCARRVVRVAAMLAEVTGDRTYLDDAQHGMHLISPLVGDLTLSSIQDELPTQRYEHSDAAVENDAAHRSVPGSSTPTLTAWRALSKLDRAVDDERPALAQSAAQAFWDLSADGDPSLGGKLRSGSRGVTTIPDAHGLARHLVVLKRTARDAAQREHAHLSRLRAWLDADPARGTAGEGWLVPEPLGVVHVDDDDAVLVMRRLPGHTLAHYVLEFASGRGESPFRFYERAVDALADFHTAFFDQPGRRPENMQGSLRQGTSYLWGAEVANEVSASLAPLWGEGPQLAKKDAHAGNWLWSSAAGGLILLDVEGGTTRPVLAELATLIDDLPLLSFDEAGWMLRVELAERYLARLPAQARLDSAEIRPRLELALLHNAAVGLARTRRRDWGTSSRGVRLTKLQDDHYVATLAHLAEHASDEQVSLAARALRQR